jgi:hypothetical protein
MAPAPAPATVDYSTWSDEDLTARADVLAAERTRVRLDQVAIGVELEIRRSLAAMSPETRRVISLRLGGAVGSDGAAANKKSEATE